MKNIKTWFKRPLHIVLALLLIAILGIGSTMAWFTDIEAAINNITTGQVDISTDEKVDNLTKTDIGVTSNGSVPCYVRMRVDVPDVTYSYTKDEVLVDDAEALITPVDGTEIKASAWESLTQTPARVTRQNGTENAEWVKMNDGFWYLSVTLNQGDKAEIIESITYPGLWDVESNKVVDPLPDGLTLDMLTIPITSEAVQSENIDVGTATGADAAYAAFQVVSGQQ